MSDEDVSTTPQLWMAGYSQGADTPGDVLPHVPATSASGTDRLPILRLQ